MAWKASCHRLSALFFLCGLILCHVTVHRTLREELVRLSRFKNSLAKLIRFHLQSHCNCNMNASHHRQEAEHGSETGTKQHGCRYLAPQKILQTGLDATASVFRNGAVGQQINMWQASHCAWPAFHALKRFCGGSSPAFFASEPSS